MCTITHNHQQCTTLLLRRRNLKKRLRSFQGTCYG